MGVNETYFDQNRLVEPLNMRRLELNLCVTWQF